MQLGAPPGARTVPDDVPTALSSAAQDLGLRPAVTLLRAERREEQGVASLAQWAAKGAHLLEADLLLEAGEPLRVDLPPGWMLAAVSLAAWWAGLVVDLDGSTDAEVAVVHEGRAAPDAATDVLWTGTAIDGAPEGPVDGEPWARAVQAFPDQPPTPTGAGDRPALHVGHVTLTQREALGEAAALGVEPGGRPGVLGLTAGRSDPREAVLAVSLRPLVTARHTVVLDGGRAADADAERVAVWR